MDPLASIAADLIRQMPDGLMVVHPGSDRIIDANPAMACMLGCERGALLTKGLHELFPASGRIPSEEALASGARFETRLRHSDGSTLDLEITPIRSPLPGGIALICRDISGLRQRESFLESRAERLDLLLTQNPAVLYTCEATGDFGATFVSANVEVMLGHRAEDFTSDSSFWVRHIHPLDQERVLKGLEVLYQDGECTHEYRFQHRDGTFRWMHDQVRLLRDAHGNPKELLGFWIDITDRRGIEEALRESEQNYRELVEGVPGVVYAFSTTRGGIYYSSCVTQLLGYTPERLYAEPLLWQQSIHPDDLPEIQAVLRETTAGQPFRIEYRIRNAQGEWRWFSDRSLGYRIDGSETIIEGLALDITESKRAEEQIRKLSGAVEQSPVSVIITNRNGDIEYANPKFTRVTGYTLEEVRGRNPRILKGGKTSPALYQELWSTISQGNVWRGELLNRKKDGAEYWESACIAPILNHDGEITHFLAVKEDISDKRALEEQLRQAQKLESIGQLAGGVAHDFNNILAIVMMHIGFLEEAKDQDAATRESLKELMTEAKRAASLTSQLLIFSRRTVLETQVFDLNLRVAEMLKMLRRLIGSHIAVRFEPRDPILPITADPGMVEQVLMNLTLNARDAMPRGGSIHIRSRCQAITAARIRGREGVTPGLFACLSVTDTGCGMSPATLARIFEPFFTTKELGKGTGLGLATVHGIVTQHKGWVEVESQPGIGSTFRVFFPAATANPRLRQESAPGPTPGGDETILLVEDDEALRPAVARAMRQMGYRVLEAGNGREALLSWQDNAPSIDLLFSDMVMPEGMTGAELAGRLRETKPALRVILTTGYSEQLAAAGRPSGDGMMYLQKPYPNEILAKVLRQVLDQI